MMINVCYRLKNEKYEYRYKVCDNITLFDGIIFLTLNDDTVAEIDISLLDFINIRPFDKY